MLLKLSLREWCILIPLITALCMVMLDGSILPVALPTIQKDLHVSPLVLQWIVNSYFLANASLVLAGGRLADIFGRKEIFLTGLVLFGVSSAVGGFAGSGAWLVISRLFQGVGSAMMTPAAFAIIMSTFPQQSRGKAVGMSVSISSVCLSLGPSIGGLFTEYLTWRWVFWINLPIGLLGLYFTAMFVPSIKPKRVKMDYMGLFLVVLSISLLIVGIMQADDLGWDSSYILGALVISAFSFFILVIYSKRASYPFIDFGLFKNTVFLAGCCLIAMVQFLLVNPVYWVIYFQEALGYTAFEAGALTIVSTVPVFFLPPIAGYLSDHMGARFPITLGFLISIGGFVTLFLYFYFLVFTALVVGLLLFGVGVALVMTPSSTTAVGSVDSEQRGLATGLYNTFRYTGASIGVAILGLTLLTTKETAWKKFTKGHQEISTEQKKDAYRLFHGKNPSTEIYTDLDKEAKEMAVFGSKRAMRYNMIISTGLAALGVLLTLVYIRPYKNKEET